LIGKVLVGRRVIGGLLVGVNGRGKLLVGTRVVGLTVAGMITVVGNEGSELVKVARVIGGV